MDNLTHGLVGIGIAALGQNLPQTADEKSHRAIFWAAAIGSQAPDLDVLYRLKGQLAYLEFHRGFSHSFPSALVISLAITLLLSLIWPTISRLRVFITALAATVVHIFLDILTSYGTRAFWPLYDKPLYLDTLMIIDPFIIFAGFLALFLRRKYKLSPLRVYSTMLTVIGLYIVFRFSLHQHAVKLVQDYMPQEQAAVISVIPSFGFRQWNYVIDPVLETQLVEVGYVDAIKGHVRKEKQYIPATGPVIDAANQSEAGIVFLNFARHPVSNITEGSDSYLVTWKDVRYRYGERYPFYAYARLDKELNILESGIGSKYK